MSIIICNQNFSVSTNFSKTPTKCHKNLLGYFCGQTGTRIYIYLYIYIYDLPKRLYLCTKQHGVTSHNTTILSKPISFFHRESWLQPSVLDLGEIQSESRLEHLTGFTWFFLVSPVKYWVSTRALLYLPNRFNLSLSFA